MDGNAFVAALVIGVVVAGAFLIFREAVTWYLKANEIVQLLKKTNELLTQIAGHVNPNPEPPAAAQQAPPATENDTTQN